MITALFYPTNSNVYAFTKSNKSDNYFIWSYVVNVRYIILIYTCSWADILSFTELQ